MDEKTLSPDEQALKQLYIDLCQYSMDKDARGIASVLSDDYYLQHMSGMKQLKQEYIDAVLDGTLNYYTTDHDSISVSVDPSGDTAKIRGRSRINAAVFGGGRRTWRLQQDLTAEKIDGQWLLTSSKASIY